MDEYDFDSVLEQCRFAVRSGTHKYPLKVSAFHLVHRCSLTNFLLGHRLLHYKPQALEATHTPAHSFFYYFLFCDFFYVFIHLYTTICSSQLLQRSDG